MQERMDQQRCPVCGTGVFTDAVYEDPEPGGPELRQAGDSYEVLLFSCGHEVKGAPARRGRTGPDDRRAARERGDGRGGRPGPSRPADEAEEEER